MKAQTIVVLENVDITASGTTEKIHLESWDRFSATVSIVGTPTGTFKLQGSNDTPIGSIPGEGLIWIDIDGSLRNLASSGDIMYSMSGANFRFLRGVYNAGPGSAGLMTFTVHLRREGE